MTITIDIRPEVQAELARQAAAQGAASLLEEAAHLSADTARPARRKRPPGRKSLVQLFAESPWRGLDLAA